MNDDRTLNQLEGPTERPASLSPQGALAHDLRNVPLRDLRTADLRVLIAEGAGLGFVVPLALDILKVDPDAAGDRYAGDLMAAVERVPAGFWLTHPDLRTVVEKIQLKRIAAEFGN